MSRRIERCPFVRQPYLNSCKGQITQETLNLIMSYHNHRRYQRGKRQGKAPIELLTGEALQGNWVDLLIQHKRAAEIEAHISSTPTLALVPHLPETTSPLQTMPEQATCESRADADLPWQGADKKVA